MGRMAKAADRLPSQRDTLAMHGLEAEVSRLILENKEWIAYAKQISFDRVSSQRHARNLEKQLAEAKAVTSTVECTSPQTVLDVPGAVLDECTSDKHPGPASEEMEIDCNFHEVRVRFRGKPTLRRTRTFPPGCRLIRGGVPEEDCALALPHLELLVEANHRPITAGQTDGKRRQTKVGNQLSISKALVKALDDAGELAGRTKSEVNVLQSLAGCKAQKLHWDFDPGLIECLPATGPLHRKPVSVILALEPGTRLFVRDEAAGATVPIALGVGDILVFDGDVAHHGAWYASRNTRVHMYLDVPTVPRVEDFTWFKRF